MFQIIYNIVMDWDSGCTDKLHNPERVRLLIIILPGEVTILKIAHAYYIVCRHVVCVLV